MTSRIEELLSRLSSAQIIPDLRLNLVYQDGTNDSLEVLLEDAEAGLRSLLLALDKVKVAAKEYKRTTQNFAESVRRDSGFAYPWPSMDTASDELKEALAAIEPYLTTIEQAKERQ